MVHRMCAQVIVLLSLSCQTITVNAQEEQVCQENVSPKVLLTLETDRDEYLPCEPVLIRIRLKNVSNETFFLRIASPTIRQNGSVRFWVRQIIDGVETLREWDNRPSLHVPSGESKPTKLAPNDQFVGEWAAIFVYEKPFSFVFDKAGQYELVAKGTIRIGKTQKSFFEDIGIEKVEVETTKTIHVKGKILDAEARIVEMLLNNHDIARFFTAIYSGIYREANKKVRDLLLPVIQRAISEVPSSPYAAYFNYALAWSYFLEYVGLRSQSDSSPQAVEACDGTWRKAEEHWRKSFTVARETKRHHLAAKSMGYIYRVLSGDHGLEGGPERLKKILEKGGEKVTPEDKKAILELQAEAGWTTDTR